MNTRTFSREPDYTWMLTPHSKGLLELNYNYKIKVVDWTKEYQKCKIRLQLREKALNEKTAAGNPATSLEWSTLGRNKEALSLELNRRKTAEIQLRHRLDFESAKVAGMFNDLFNDFKCGYLTKEKYIEYLSNYQQITDSSNGLKCYETQQYDRIKKEVETHLHPKAIINETEISKATGRSKKRASKQNN